jgi:O-succinylbenzoate synthase
MNSQVRVVAVYSIPLRTRFRGIDTREGMLIEGPAGYAEFSPFWDYGTTESANWWRAAVEAATSSYPKPRREAIPVNCTVPAVGPDQAHAIVVASNGCRTAKVKVADPAQSLADDIARVEAVRDALGPDGRIRVDANGGWDVESAIAAIKQLDHAANGLEYVEQPCATVEELAACRRRASALIAADESMRRADDPMRVARLAAADIAVLKVQPLGGIAACLRIAEEIGLPIVVSSALETSVGIATGLALAAALPELPYACGLATTSLLTSDVVADPLVPLDGVLPVCRPAVSSDRLAETAASEDVRSRWATRLEAIHKRGRHAGGSGRG